MASDNLIELEVRGAENFPATVSSEFPVDRGDYEEILVHDDDSIDFERSTLPLLLNHDPNVQVGIVERFKMVGGKLKAVIRFASDELSKQYEKDVADMVRQSLSVGYQILDSFVEGTKRLVTKWKPLEVSIVPIPADPQAGFYRSATFSSNIKELKDMNEEKTSKEQERRFRKEIAEIRALGKHHGLSDLADSAIESGLNLEQFRSKLLDEISNAEPLPLAPVVMTKRTHEEYNVSRAILGCIDPQYRGFEHEISQDLARDNKKRGSNSIIIPTQEVLGQRTLSASNLGGNISSIADGSKLVPFVQRFGVYGNLGIQEFTGLSSDLKVPRETSAATASFLTLDGSTDITEGTPTMDSITFSPTSLACFTQLSHKLLLQSSVNMDSVVRNLMATTIANKLDYAVINGSGSSNEPTGMVNTTGINTESYTTAIGYADVLNALETLANDSIPMSNLTWVINPAEISSLASTDKGTDTGSFLLEMQSEQDGRIGSMLGFPVYVSEHVTAGEAVLVRGQHSAIGFFGGLEVEVDPYFDFQKGNIGIRAIQDLDFHVLNANSICLISAA